MIKTNKTRHPGRWHVACRIELPEQYSAFLMMAEQNPCIEPGTIRPVKYPAWVHLRYDSGWARRGQSPAAFGVCITHTDELVEVDQTMDLDEFISLLVTFDGTPPTAGSGTG